VPRQVQVRTILANAIDGGLFPSGSRMPDARQIAVEVNTGLATVRRAIMFLVKEGWLERDAFGHTLVKRPVRNRAKSAVQLCARPGLGPASTLEECCHRGFLTGDDLSASGENGEAEAQEHAPVALQQWSLATTAACAGNADRPRLDQPVV